MHTCSLCKTISETLLVHISNNHGAANTMYACKKCLSDYRLVCGDHNSVHHVKIRDGDPCPVHVCPRCIQESIQGISVRYKRYLVRFAEDYIPHTVLSTFYEPVIGECTTKEYVNETFHQLVLAATLEEMLVEDFISHHVANRPDATLH